MDYIFYRIYLYYKRKKDGPISRGIIFLFVLQYCTVFLVLSIFNIITDGLLTIQNPDFKKEYFYVVYGIVLFIFFVLDTLRYAKTKKIKELELKYHNRGVNYRIKTWMIFIIPFLLVVLSIFLSVVFSDHVSGLLIPN